MGGFSTYGGEAARGRPGEASVQFASPRLEPYLASPLEVLLGQRGGGGRVPRDDRLGDRPVFLQSLGPPARIGQRGLRIPRQVHAQSVEQVDKRNVAASLPDRLVIMAVGGGHGGRIGAVDL